MPHAREEEHDEEDVDSGGEQEEEVVEDAVDASGAVDSIEVSKLRRKYLRAVRKGRIEKAEKLREKLVKKGATVASLGSTIAEDESAIENAFVEEHSKKDKKKKHKKDVLEEEEQQQQDEDTAEVSKKHKKRSKEKHRKHEEYSEEEATHIGAGSSHSAPISSTSSSSSSSSSSSHSTTTTTTPITTSSTTTTTPADPHEGMVLAKNGKWYPKPQPLPPGNVTLLLFYAYVQPPWTSKQRAAAIEYTHNVLTENGCTGRLRVALEGFNSTLTGPAQGIRNFCQALREYDPAQFSNIDFKFVDGLQDNKAFRFLKVWPVQDLVNYGFKPEVAPLGHGGTHVKPDEWTKLAAEPNTVMIDVRNANETAIGWFKPPEGGATLLDPRMRRSTEFETWVDSNMNELKGKKIMMYCTAGIRCERASALLANKGLDKIFQLEGGIHRYLDAYAEDGGIWVGKNYTFDKRFSHGAVKGDIVSKCSCCGEPWERYQAQEKCSICRMEALVCRDCQRGGKPKKMRVLCWLCEEAENDRKNGKTASAAAQAAQAAARAFAATGGGRDGEGEGAGTRAADDEDTGGGGGGGGGGNWAPRFNKGNYGGGGGGGGGGGARGYSGGGHDVGIPGNSSGGNNNNNNKRITFDAYQSNDGGHMKKSRSNM